jgi:hypothetical protein
VLDVTGHCPNLSAPEETVAAIRRFLATRPVGGAPEAVRTAAGGH